MTRRRRYEDTVFSAHSVAAPEAPTARVSPADEAGPAPSSPTRRNRHAHRPAATGSHGTVSHLDVAHAARTLATAPVVVPATVTGVAGVVLVSLTGTAGLLALPAPILAGLVWAAYALGRARGADQAATRAALEAGPGARLALEAAQHDENETGGRS